MSFKEIIYLNNNELIFFKFITTKLFNVEMTLEKKH